MSSNNILKICYIHLICLYALKAVSQTDSIKTIETPNILNPIKSHNNAKKWTIGTVQVGLWTGSFISLNKAWYANYPRTKFHFYNDWKEWQHMDKAGHFWSTYHISHFTADLWKWTGTKDRKSNVIGAISGLGYLSVVEILDGYSDKWGFSLPDMAANSLGAMSFLGQEMAWQDQRIKIKLSYTPYSYGNLRPRSDELFGKGILERILKDYNSQTYWASMNIKSFFPESKVPAWLDVSIGYGAKTMLGGYENKWVDAQGVQQVRKDIPRYKRTFISLDVDLDKIQTKNKVLKKTLHLLNIIKIPAPALEFQSSGAIKMHLMYF